MTEYSKPWDGVAVGDAILAPYDAPTDWAEIWRSFLGADYLTGDSGIFPNSNNQLSPLPTGAVSPALVGTSPLTVDAGAALVYGTWYNSTVQESIVIPTPAGATRQDRVVLRKDWAAQTVRLFRIAGVEGGSDPPLVQNAGVTWDMPIAWLTITTLGVLSMVDERQLMTPAPLPYVQVGAATSGKNFSAPNNTATPVPWPQNIFESTPTQAARMHSTGSNTERFYAEAWGIYEVSGFLLYSTGAGGSLRLIVCRGAYVGLSGTNNIAKIEATATGGTVVSMVVPPFYVSLEKGSYIQFVVHQVTGVAMNVFLGEATDSNSAWGRATFKLIKSVGA